MKNVFEKYQKCIIKTNVFDINIQYSFTFTAL